MEVRKHTIQLSVQIEEKNWKRTSKDNPTPADLGFGNISYEPNVGTSEKEDKQEEDIGRSPVSRPNLSDNTRNILDEIMHEDPQIDCEPPKEQRERASRPNKRKSTSWKKSSVQSKMEKMASNLFTFTKTSTSSSEAGKSPTLSGSDPNHGGPDKI